MGEARLAKLVRDGLLDAELGGLLWLLAGARTPLVVAGRGPEDRDPLLDALADLLPGDARLVTVAPDDDFEWLREAVELGWRRDRVGERPVPHGAMSSAEGVLVARSLGDPGGVTGGRARIVVRALALGYGLLATTAAHDLEELLERLGAPDVATDEDERSRLGVVLVLDEARLVAAHYVRPVALDAHGHVQRTPPAVLATWNPGRRAWDHFAWGVLAELGARIGLAPMDLEREQARRASALASSGQR